MTILNLSCSVVDVLSYGNAFAALKPKERLRFDPADAGSISFRTRSKRGVLAETHYVGDTCFSVVFYPPYTQPLASIVNDFGTDCDDDGYVEPW